MEAYIDAAVAAGQAGDQQAAVAAFNAAASMGSSEVLHFSMYWHTLQSV
jgi:hypothetical protein